MSRSNRALEPTARTWTGRVRAAAQRRTLAGPNLGILMKIAVQAAIIWLAGILAVGGQSPAGEWTVSLRGVGPLTIGASLGEVRRIVGDPSAILRMSLHSSRPPLPREPDDSPCAYLATTKVPNQIGLMFQRGHLARIDIEKSGIRTTGGAEVGDTEAKILELYGSRIKVTQHDYPPVGAHYMIFTPVDTEDHAYQMLFETDGAKVTRFRVGLKEAVALKEGCL